MQPIRVLQIDDHKLFAEAIRAALGKVGMDVLPVATSGAQGVEAARSGRPDVVLVDLSLPDRDGVGIGKQILAECPGTKVVVLTAISDNAYVKQSAIAGFHGYLTKHMDMDRLVRSIEAVVRGEGVVHTNNASRGEVGSRRRTDLLTEHLTKRERSVLALLVEGSSSEQIARVLAISPNTVRTHIQNVLTKLQVHSRLEAAAFAVKRGLVETREPPRRMRGGGSDR